MRTVIRSLVLAAMLVGLLAGSGHATLTTTVVTVATSATSVFASVPFTQDVAITNRGAGAACGTPSTVTNVCRWALCGCACASAKSSTGA